MHEQNARQTPTPAAPELASSARTPDMLTSMPVTVYAGRELRGFVVALNEDGILAALPVGVSAEKIVEVEFEMPDDERRMRVVGEVTWSNVYVGADGVGFSGVGIEFFGIGDEGREYLEQFVSANDGEAYWQQRELDTLI